MHAHMRQTIVSVHAASQKSASVTGFCGLPDVTSPADLKAYWMRACKPRLDGLYGLCSACGPEVQLLHMLDGLICELKNIQIKARHCAAHHADV